MSLWFENPAHIVFILLFFVCATVFEGIIIFYLTRCQDNIKYGDTKTAKYVLLMKKYWGPLVVYILATSIIMIFITNLVFKRNITLEDMNTWVSLILGFVALIVGIISLLLSFYNLDQMVNAQKVVEDKVNEMNNGSIGWQEENGDWRYYDRKGEIVRNEWKKSGHNWYHLGADGYIEKGVFVFKDNGAKIYYVDNNGCMVKNAFIKSDERYRYFDELGNAVMEGERTIDGKMYKFKNGFAVEK